MKKTKLTVELLFIFLLPLLLILMNCTFNYNNELFIKSISYNGLMFSNVNPIRDLLMILYDFLGANTGNIVITVIIDYTTLFFIFFVIWHLFYGLMDFFVHFKSSKE